MSRSAMLQRLRSATRQEPAPQLPSRVPEFPYFEDPVKQFKEALEAVGGVFLEGRQGQLSTSLEQVLRETEATEIFWECEELFKKHDLPYHLRDPLSFEGTHLVFSFHFGGRVKFPLVLNSRPYRLSNLATIKLTASSARYGIAETGTVAEQSGPGKGRLLPALPPAHLVLLAERDLLMNSARFFEVAQPVEEASVLTMVTGPSRTADIEKTLVVGVHGPRQCFVILTR